MKKLLTILLIALIAAVPISCKSEGCSPQSKGLSVSETEIELEQYEEYVLTANKSGVTWSSEDPRIVKVDNTGKLTTLKIGTVKIIASLGEEDAECLVTVVTSNKNRALILDKHEIVLRIGQQETVSATLKENGEPVETDITWSSSDPEVASVSSGVITAVSEGSTDITASVLFKGQSFSKNVSVTVVSYKAAVFSVVDTGVAIPLFEGSSTDLGFDDNATVYKWDTNGSGWDDRIWDSEVSTSVAEYDLFVAEIKFTSTEACGPLFWANGNPAVVKFANDLFGDMETYCTSDDPTKVMLYDNLTKEPANTYYIKTDRTYTIVVDMSSYEWVPYAVGIFKISTVYIANPMFCSAEYARLAFTKINWPKIKDTKGLYIVSGDTLSVMDLCGEEGYEDFAKVPLMTDGWGNRLQVGRSDINTTFIINAKYSEYDFFGFEIIFTDTEKIASTYSAFTFWNGSLNAIFMSKAGDFSTQHGTPFTEGDVIIFKNGIDVTGEELESNVLYDFRIKIKAEADPYGLGIFGSEGFAYVGRPYFM